MINKQQIEQFVESYIEFCQLRRKLNLAKEHTSYFMRAVIDSKALSEKEIAIIRYRLRLDEAPKPLSHEKVAKRLHESGYTEKEVSRQRVDQIEKKALSKLNELL